MPGRAFIYALAEPNTGVVRYVGKAADPHVRVGQHLRDRSSLRKARWLRSLDAPPQLLILEEIPAGADWQEAERRWIAHFRAEGADLTNHTDGGEGLCGASAETRAKLSASAKARMADPAFRAKVFTAERAARISAALSGRPKSPEHVAKLPQNQPGCHHTDEAKQRMRLASTGRQHSVATIELLREASRGNAYGVGNRSRTGQTPSVEELRKRSAATKGRPKGEAHRQRIAEGLTKAWAAGRRTAVQGERVAWPPWAEIEMALASETVGEVALRLGVRRGTLAAHIMRRRRGAPEQRRAAA
jgi:hypothetical protein